MWAVYYQLTLKIPSYLRPFLSGVTVETQARPSSTILCPCFSWTN